MKQFDKWNNVKKNIHAKKDDFTRPVLVLKKFTNTALLVQAKMFDVKRLDCKIGTIKKEDFEQLKNQMRSLLAL